MEGANLGSNMLQHFSFAPGYRNLNNGSFGAVPKPVATAQRQFQSSLEAAPDVFIHYQQPKLLRQSREALAEVINAPLSTVVFVQNATTAFNVVLRNLTYEPGDMILMFSTLYGACHKTILSVCETTACDFVNVPVEFPVSHSRLLDIFEAEVTKAKVNGTRIKLAVFDTISSRPGVRMPFEALIRRCKNHGILSCVDAAHGVGQLPLDMTTLDPDFLFSNQHKWLHVPRACALLYIPQRNQHLIRTTLPTSHGFAPLDKTGPANPLPVDEDYESPYVHMFDYVGTADISAFLCIPAALEFRRTCGGEQQIMAYCANLASKGAALVAERLGTEVMENEEGTLQRGCAMANVRLPLEGTRTEEGVGLWIQARIAEEYNGFLVVYLHGNAWWTRLSAQIWLGIEDFEWAAGVLNELCKRVNAGEHLA